MHVRMQIGPEEYALAVGDVLEVVDAPEVTPVPGAPSCILGVCNLRGTVLPVVDAAKVLRADGGDARQIVITEGAAGRAGVAVDQVIEVGVLPDARESTESVHLSATVLHDQRLVGIVDLDSLLNAVRDAA